MKINMKVTNTDKNKISHINTNKSKIRMRIK